MKRLKLFEEFNTEKAPEFIDLSDFLEQMEDGYEGHREDLVRATKMISETMGLPYSDIVAVEPTMFDDMGSEDTDIEFFGKTLGIHKIARTKELTDRDSPLISITMRVSNFTRQARVQTQKVYDASTPSYKCCVWYCKEWDFLTEVYFFSGYHLAKCMISSGEFDRFLNASNVREFLSFIGRFLPGCEEMTPDEILHKYRGSSAGHKYKV